MSTHRYKLASKAIPYDLNRYRKWTAALRKSSHRSPSRQGWHSEGQRSTSQPEPSNPGHQRRSHRSLQRPRLAQIVFAFCQFIFVSSSSSELTKSALTKSYLIESIEMLFGAWHFQCYHAIAFGDAHLLFIFGFNIIQPGQMQQAMYYVQ